ncbi:MAG: carboxypeptidase regulatory-like domain-containing protein [Candidatus Acidiferrales bacterium]
MRVRFDKYFRLAVSLIALLLSLPALVSAQSVVTGGLTGIVTDSTGSVIVGATLNLKNQATSEVLTATTGSTGAYQFTLLKPGVYVVSVSQSGFKQVSETVEVLLGQTAVASVKLEVGATTETVTVTEQGALLQTEDANISSNFDTNQIQNVPNPGGDITYVAQSAPGITMNSSTGGGYGNFSAFGLPGTSNLFTVNGNDYNDAFLNLNNSGSSNLLLGGNELQEVAVVSNGYTGQYGRQAGAQIDYSTKSGSNAFHGDAVYNWTGRALTANDPLNKAHELAAGLPNARPFENNNQWAASIGGPIKKDKAYFFVNTEGIRYIFGAIQNVSVPTPAFQNFVMGNVPSDAATQAFYANVFKLYNSAPGVANATPNADSCPGFATAPGATGGACTESFSQSVSSGNKEWLLSGRVDYSFGENDKLFGRVRFDRGVQPTYTDPINPEFNNSSTQPQNEGQLNYTHIFSPTVVNNFIFSDLYYSAVFGNLNPSSALDLFPGNLEFLVDGALTPLGTGSGNPNGFAAGFQFPEGRHVEQWQLVDDLSVTRGNHDFKMGVNFKRDDVSDFTAAENTLYPEVDVTLFGFANDQVAPTGCSTMANSQLGCGSVIYNFASQIEQPVAFYSFGLYFQDQYRVNSKLKLTMTLRADRNSGGICHSSCASLPVTPFNESAHGATIPYDESFPTGNKTIIPGIEKVVFEPRFGLAWSPVGQNTVVRAGVGLFTDLYPGGLLSLFDTNFPQVNLFNVPTGSVAFDLASPGSTAFPGSGVNLVTQCNSAFLSNYNSGGSLTTGGSSGGGYAGAAQQFGGCLNAQGALSVPNLNDVSRNFQNPKYVEWNLEIQHTFGARTVVSANYVGNHGYDGLVLNPTLNGFGFGNLPAAAPDPRVGRVDYLYTGAVSNYNGVTFSIQENQWHGLTGRLNYTYSHALDELSNVPEEPFSVITSILTQINPYNLHSQYASGDNDARHQISGTYVYQLPFKSENRLMNAAIGGWMVSGTMFYRTGFPFSIIDGGATASLAGNNLGGTSSFGANILAQPIPGFTQRNFNNGRACVLVACFGTADLVQPSTDFMGTVGRNAFRGPGFLGGDLSVRKNFQVTERATFQLALNAYNWFNHANYGSPYPNTNAPFFGQVAFMQFTPTSPYGAFAAAATDQRIAQITGKFIF